VLCLAVLHGPEAGPAPILGALDEVGAQGVAFDIAGHHQKMPVILHGKALVGSLVEVAAAFRVAMGVPAAHMSDREPVHEGRKLAIGAGPEEQMPMVGHKAPGQQAQWNAHQRLGEDLLEGGVVALILEDAAAGVAAVEAVKHDSA